MSTPAEQNTAGTSLSEPAAAAGPEDFVVRPARPDDVPEMVELLSVFATQGLLLPRTEADLLAVLEEFCVCVHDGTVVGLGSLHAYSPELGEVRSLAVREGCQRHGLGGRLVEWAVARAAEQGITRVFALTYRARFFQRLGFERIPRASLPEKVWGDCRKCPKAEYCDEVAVACAVPPVIRA